MRSKLAIAAAALACAATAAFVWFHQEITALEAERVTDDVHVVQAGGINGNVAVLRTGDGAVVVDTMTFRAQGVRLRELAERIGGGPVQVVINTHYHLDHTHGNPGFPVGTRIVATQRTRGYMLDFDRAFWRAEGLWGVFGSDATGTLPNETFESEHALRIGGKTIRALHLGRGHTGGDLAVLFVEDRVLHLGDLLFQGRYPNIDLEAGGSIEAWIDTLDRALALDFERVIPGHGPVTDREGIRAFQGFLRELWAIGEQAAREGLSLERAQELARRTMTSDRGLAAVGIPLVRSLDRDFVVRRAFEEATGAVAAPEGAG
jgi:glyoxylase-like metal-dependent hydrolase (beta-lactamase superfamily II)